MIVESGDVIAEMRKELALNTFRFICGRIGEIQDGTIQALEVHGDAVHLELSNHNYAMGCYQGTYCTTWDIPYEVFFSHAPLSVWMNQQLQDRQEAAAERLRLEIEARDLQKSIALQEKQAKKKDREYAEYLRLKAIYAHDEQENGRQRQYWRA